MKNQGYTQNVNRLEIEICTGCNLGCHQCDRSSSQAPSDECMTVSQVRKFVSESIALGYMWTEIEILGGEPALHPDVFGVIRALRYYLNFNTDCRLLFVSNGYGRRVRETLALLPGEIVIQNTNKERENKLPFNDFNIAPVDLPRFRNDDYTRGCCIIDECGMGLSRYGFYACGAGASIDRVFGFDIGLKYMADISEGALLEQRKILCQFCGHYKGMDYRVRTCPEMSPSWVETYMKYKKRRPTLTLYGPSGR